MLNYNFNTNGKLKNHYIVDSLIHDNIYLYMDLFIYNDCTYNPVGKLESDHNDRQSNPSEQLTLAQHHIFVIS